MLIRRDKQDQRAVTRWTKTEKRFIAKAALRGEYRNLSDFIRKAVLDAAKVILCEEEHTKHVLPDS